MIKRALSHTAKIGTVMMGKMMMRIAMLLAILCAPLPVNAASGGAVEFAVNSSSGVAVCGVSQFGRIMQPKVEVPSVGIANRRHPSSSPLVKTSALEASAAAFPASAIAGILLPRSLTQVGYPVIAPVSVDMVDFVFWPCAREQSPCHAVAQIGAPPKAKGPVFVCAPMLNFIVWGLLAAVPHLPSQNSSVWIVRHQFTETFNA